MELTRERDLLRSQPIAPVSEPSRMAPGVSRVKAVAPSGQDVSVGDEGESDPMRRAVLAGDVEALRNLIASGADVLQLTGDGQSLLHLAVDSCNVMEEGNRWRMDS